MSVTNIGIFGRRNVGKSSIINLLAGQTVAIVSDIPGTTTDPVRKRMEIFGIGPCVITDTAGIDDRGDLGRMRVERSTDVVSQIDLAVLVYTAADFGSYEESLMAQFHRYGLPVVILCNKVDTTPMDHATSRRIEDTYGIAPLPFCAQDAHPDRTSMLERLTCLIREGVSRSQYREAPMFEGLVSPGKKVLLICPIDSEAPTGRLILPQVNAIRNLLDIGAAATVVQPPMIAAALQDSPPHLAVTDSQVFAEVAAAIPEEVPLTSFSMLLARSKGCFEEYLASTPHIDRLQDGDRVLILESCTHHSSCEDIGRVKLPALLRKYTGRQLDFDVVGGLDAIGRPIEDYALVLQCGGCMITKRQLHSRLLPAIERGIPVSNYGMAISYMKGIYHRALKPLTR